MRTLAPTTAVPVPVAEVRGIHTQLLRVTLEAEQSRAYWRHGNPTLSIEAETEAAFTEYWFGSKSMSRVRKLVRTFRQRFAAYPDAFATLRAWDEIDRDTRTLVCHWHLQLTDPIYRRFTGEYVPERRYRGRAQVTRDAVLTWVGKVDAEDRWSAATRVGFASKLLSAAHAAGLVGSIRDPRPLLTPKVPPLAMAYLMYLLRSVEFEGSLHDNPYLRSVGLDGTLVDDRLRAVPSIEVRRAGEVVDFTWTYPSLSEWGTQALGISAPTQRSRP